MALALCFGRVSSVNTCDHKKLIPLGYACSITIFGMIYRRANDSRIQRLAFFAVERNFELADLQFL
jgi:hypothetical protein